MAAVAPAGEHGLALWITIILLAIAALTLSTWLLRERRTANRRLRALLERADCMVWEAEVRRTGDRKRWTFTTQPSGLFHRLFSDLPAPPPDELWPKLELLDKAAMDATSQKALESGAPGYQQEFRVRKGDTIFWLQEMVTITRKAPDRWYLVGVDTDVTPWRTTMQSMEAKEEQVHQILARADCLLWRATVTRDGDTLRWGSFQMPTSGLYPRLFGDRDPAIGSKLWSFINVPALPEMNARSRAALFANLSGYEQQFCAITATETIWLREKVSIRADGPNIWQLVGVLIDVTAQSVAESATQAAAARFRELFEHAPVAILEASLAGVETWINEQRVAGVPDIGAHLDANPAAVAAIAGRVRIIDANQEALHLFKASTPAELEGRLRDLLPAGGFRPIARALHAGEDVIEADLDVCDLEGRLHHAAVRCWFGPAADAAPRDQAVIAVVDLTQMKRAETALAAEKERLAVTLRAMADGVITTDTQGIVQFINQAAARLIKHPIEATTGRPITDLFTFRDAQADQPLAVPIPRVVQGDVVVDLPPRTELHDHHGDRRIVEGCCAPIHGPDSIVLGTVLVMRDVTERDRFDQQLARASKLESVGVLAGGIAHDFNNILTVIVGNLNLAFLPDLDRSEVEHALREAERGALQARDLTQQLLTFAKGGEPVRAAVLLPEMLRQTAEFTVRGSRVKCEFSLPEDLWALHADKGQLGQVVQNLVLNAVQAMPTGGVIRISARNAPVGSTEGPSAAPPDDCVHLSVTDTGVGIPPEHVPRVFDPYFTTKHQGSGLGLATVYSIVTRHHGHIDVQSVLGRGTTFNIWMPALRHVVPETPPASVLPLGRFQGRVLLMDDEDAIRRMAGQLLRRLGFTVTVASDGRQAVDHYRAARADGAPFDLVIMDLTVPAGMGGQEALAEMHASDPAVKAIVSSGYSSDPVLANFREHGFCGRIAKPYQLNEFVRVIREVLAQ